MRAPVTVRLPCRVWRGREFGAAPVPTIVYASHGFSSSRDRWRAYVISPAHHTALAGPYAAAFALVLLVCALVDLHHTRRISCRLCSRTTSGDVGRRCAPERMEWRRKLIVGIAWCLVLLSGRSVESACSMRAWVVLYAPARAAANCVPALQACRRRLAARAWLHQLSSISSSLLIRLPSASVTSSSGLA